jgi:hypothetical protein
MAVSARPRQATAMSRSFSSSLQHISQHYRHECVRVAGRAAVTLVKYTSRRPVETPMDIAFSRLLAFSTVSGIQNT